ncbi:MAG TPA: EamA family transporter [Nitrososphaeraceae archaeon]|nr:EamA family transporter [Nitrososphaeraceae archaeon]
MIHKSWVVFVYAITISVESILIEFLTATFQEITSIILSSISITLAGILLLAVAFLIKRKGILTLFLKTWRNLTVASFSLAIGIFTWYDAITRIGASKEVLIAGPLEIVIVVVFARIFLSEKLDKIQIIGIILALIGFLMAVASGGSTSHDLLLDNSNSNTEINPLSRLTITTVGNIEAIVSAFGFAIGVLFLTKLVSLHSSIEISGLSMLISGLILVGIMLGFLYTPFDISSGIESFSSWQQEPSISIIIILILFSLLPFIGSLCYLTGLSRIGASITATIGSSSILITVLLQTILKELGIVSNLPQNIFVAILGGVLGFLGIYIIHIHNHDLTIRL